jgi:uncharacterized protein (TIGR02266 family)
MIADNRGVSPGFAGMVLADFSSANVTSRNGMATDPKTLMRRHLRFTRYLPAQCTVLAPEETEPRALTGMTRNVNAGGLEVLLSEALPVKTMVSVRVGGSDPIPGHIVSVDKGIPTPLGIKFPHGVAFEEPVEPSVVRHWVSAPEKRAHHRATVQFAVQYTQAGTKAHGTCLNLSQGGMFIVADRLAAPGTEVTLHFTLPSQTDPLSVRARIAWVSGEETEPDALNGMGVRFLDLTPSQAIAIGTFVDSIPAQTSGPDSS